MKRPARDTIVALSSPAVFAPGANGALHRLPQAIVRLSGAQALEFSSLVFKTQSGALTAIKGWRRLSGEVSWREHQLAATAYVMRSPRSYTREDVIELHVPALPWLLSSLLEKLVAAGARPAEPGEFTRRALENGRITLEQAESVGALIASRSADEARVYAARLQGHQHGQRETLRDEIEDLLSLVELGLDFSQEDAGVLSVDEILQRLKPLEEKARAFSGGADGVHPELDSAVLAAGFSRIVLLGPTNAGKSSLFNRLLGRDAAIVSAMRHTTRDTIEAMLTLSESESALLIDSAGFGSEISLSGPALPTDFLRLAAWQAAMSAVRTADILLVVMDRSTPLVEQDGAPMLAKALAGARPATAAVLWTKCDLPAASGWSPQAVSSFGNLENASHFELSAHSGAGLDALRTFLSAQITTLEGRPRDASLSAAVVARTAARSAAEAIQRAREGLAAGHGEDIVAVELREAVHAFWQAEGVLIRHDAITESALDRIFSRFCIGK